MECPQRFTHRLLPTTTVAQNCFKNTSQFRNYPLIPLPNQTAGKPIFSLELITTRRYRSSSSSVARASWLLGLGEKKQKQSLPDIVKAGDPVLHEPARDVSPEEIGSERIQKIVDDMVKVMRTAPGVGLAAPQIGIPLKNKEPNKRHQQQQPQYSTSTNEKPMMGFLQRFAHHRILGKAKQCIKSTTTTTATFPPLHRIIYPDPVTRLSNQTPRNFNAHAPFSYPKTSFTPEHLITTRRNHTSSSSPGSDSDSDRLFKLTPPCLDIYMIEQTGRGIGVILALIIGTTCHFLGVGQKEQKQNLPEIVEEEEETLPVKAGSPVTALGPGGLAAPQVGIRLKEQDGSSDAPSSSGGRSSPSP